MLRYNDSAGDLQGEKTELLEKKLYIGDAVTNEWRYFLHYLDKKAGVDTNTKSAHSTQAKTKGSTDTKVEWRRRGNQLTMANRKEAVSMAHVLVASRETEKEREARIRSLFTLFNSINVGHINSTQIQSSLLAMRIPAGYKFTKVLLHVCDASQDGRIDYHEFQKYMDDKELELYAIFQAIDVEHNAWIVPEELGDALVKVGIELDEKELASFVEHVDEDNNGVNTF